MATIELDKICKHFADGTEAVQDISLTIGEGELFILLGPSGCGKSTLLNMIVGLEPVSSGEIRLDGRPINDLDPRDRNMAMVFQSYALYPHLTVRDNLAFPLKLAGRNRQDIERRVAEVAKILELEELLHRLPRRLSGGQRQRVAMGRAMVREPAAFLLDEPLSNLDSKLRSRMRAEIARLQQQLQTTMVYVTHDQTEAISLGHRLAVLRRGRLQQVGTPRELYHRPANLFVAGFIGNPPMNFLPGRLQQGRLHLPFLDNGIELPQERVLSDQNVIVGIRPEQLTPVEDFGSEPQLAVTLSLVEWLGADAWGHFSLDIDPEYEHFSLPEELDQKVDKAGRVQGMVRLDPACQLNHGQVLHLKIDTGLLHLFNPQTGSRLDR